MKIQNVKARDLPDLWFQAVYNILDHGRKFKIDQGSFAGQMRLEYDYFIGHITHPGTRPLLPEIPSHIDIPAPVEESYVFGGDGSNSSYVEYLMTSKKAEGESYTYGQRLSAVDPGLPRYRPSKEFNDCHRRSIDKIKYFDLVKWDELNEEYSFSAIDWVIREYRDGGPRNNQMVLQVAQPSDLLLDDPPCLRHIDTRIQDGALHFFVYFRSWDLWSGLPANLAAIQTLKEYMAEEIGVEDGEMIVESKGLHVYDYAERLAKMRCGKDLE